MNAPNPPPPPHVESHRIASPGVGGGNGIVSSVKVGAKKRKKKDLLETHFRADNDIAQKVRLCSRAAPVVIVVVRVKIVCDPRKIFFLRQQYDLFAFVFPFSWSGV